MKKAIAVSLVLALAVIFSGCTKGTNIFGWMTPAPGDLPVTAANAANAYAAGDYAAAMAQYEALIAANGQDSSAKYGYVKAYVKSVGLDLASLIKSTSGNNAPAFLVPGVVQKVSSQSAGYLLESNTAPFGINALVIEQLCEKIILHLNPIALGECDGVIPANDVSLNVTLAFAHLLKGVFTIIDPGQDGTIDYNIYDNGSTSEVVLWGTTTLVDSGTFDSVKATAQTALANSISRFDVAIATAGGGSIWEGVRDFLVQIQTEFNSL